LISARKQNINNIQIKIKNIDGRIFDENNLKEQLLSKGTDYMKGKINPDMPITLSLNERKY